jgi:hypothetical protein
MLVSVHDFTQLSGRADFFTLFYFELCVWPGVISGWIRQRNSIKFYSNFGESATETLAVIRQEFGEEGVSRTLKVQTHRDRNRWDS